MLILPDLKVGYQNIPKVATTSVFTWLHTCVALARTGKLPVEPFHRRFFLGTHREGALASSVDNVAADVAPYEDHYRFALTRDPVRRFISMYSNRVLFHRELSEKNPVYPVLKKAGLEPDPEINLLVDRLDAYCAVQNSVHHHARPMMSFLGPDLGVFQRIADISAVDSCIQDMRRHFSDNGLDIVATKAPPLGRSQTGGPKLGLEVLNPYSFEKLLDLYREDYEKVPTVDIQQTKDAYRKARDQAFVALAAAVTDAKATARPAKGNVAARDSKKGKAAPATPAARVKKEGAAGKGKPARAAAATVTYVECPLVQKVRVVADAAGKAWTGFVLLRPAAGEGFRLELQTPAGTVAATWGLPSPKLGTSFPDNPHASRARFRMAEVSAGSACELRIVGADGEAWPLARFVG